MTVRVLVTGGGTSGHVIPAIALIEALGDEGVPPSDIAYVGARRGVETSMVPATGVICEFLPISGLQRSLSPRSMARNLLLPFRLVRSVVLARLLVRRFAPSVVVSVGGYASEPAARAAVSAGIPLVCVSYDCMPGLATRRQAPHAAVCAVAFPGSVLPHAELTGAPVRRSVRTMDVAGVRATKRSAMGVGDSTVLVTIVGGSLGSQALNDSVQSVISELELTGIRAHIHHVTGPRYARSHGAVAGNVVSLSVVPYEDDMPAVLAATDVLVSRAGAGTVAEIATVGVPSVLVPWPGAAENHQLHNAEWLGGEGAAVVVQESGHLAADISREVVQMASDSARRTTVSQRARDMGELNRSNTIARVILNAATR